MKSSNVVRVSFGILRATIAEWQANRAPRLVAALAQQTHFAVGPLLVIVGVLGEKPRIDMGLVYAFIKNCANAMVYPDRLKFDGLGHPPRGESIASQAWLVARPRRRVEPIRLSCPSPGRG